MIKINIPEFKNVGSTIVKLEDVENFSAIYRMGMEIINYSSPEMERFMELLKTNKLKNGNLLQIDMFEAEKTDFISRGRYLPLINSKPVNCDIKNIPLFKGMEDILNAIKNAKKLNVEEEYLKSRKCIDCYTNFNDNDYLSIEINGSAPMEEIHEQKAVQEDAEIVGKMFKTIIKNLTKNNN